MKTKLTYLKVLSFLFLFSSSPVVFGDILQDRPEENVDPKMMEMILAFTSKDFKKVCFLKVCLRLALTLEQFLPDEQFSTPLIISKQL